MNHSLERVLFANIYIIKVSFIMCDFWRYLFFLNQFFVFLVWGWCGRGVRPLRPLWIRHCRRHLQRERQRQCQPLLWTCPDSSLVSWRNSCLQWSESSSQEQDIRSAVIPSPLIPRHWPWCGSYWQTVTSPSCVCVVVSDSAAPFPDVCVSK